MASVFEILKQGPSLSFKHQKKTYTLTSPWTDELLTELVTGSLVSILRKQLGKAWSAWKPGKKQKDMQAILAASFGTLGVDGEEMLTLLGVLGDEELCRAFQYDLLSMGYGLDVLSMVEMCVILEGLPETSRLTRVRSGAKPDDWDRKEYMLADIADIVLTSQHLMTHFKSAPGKKFKAPKPIYKRPYEVEKEKVVFSSPVALKGLLDQRRGVNDGKGVPGQG